jgi:hypothetical protein
MSNGWMRWALALALCLPGGLAAQGDVDEHHRNDCRLAEQVLTLGQPADRRDWALETVPSCGASGGGVLATQLQARHGDATDTPALEALVYATSRMTDASLFRAGLELGADPSAGAAARAAGWRVALYQLVPGSYAPPQPVDESGEAPVAGAAMTAAPMAGAPLPADAPAQARQAVQASDAGGSVAVRDAMDQLRATAELQERIARVCAPGAGLWDDACAQAVDADEAGQ